MRKFITILLLLSCQGICFAQNDVRDYVSNVLLKDAEISNASIALMAVGPDGDVIVQYNQTVPMVPASNTKLVTTGLAMSCLGPDFRFRTAVSTSGEVLPDGTLEGDLYVVGGADPTLASDMDGVLPADSLFAVWTEALRTAGISRITGNVVGDGRFLDDDVIPGTWEWDDLGFVYGNGACGLSFAKNISSFEVCPGLDVGDEASVIPLPPYSPGMTYLNEIATVDGQACRVQYHTAGIGSVGRFSGSIGIGRRTDTLIFSNKSGSLTCACAFADYLAKSGITCGGYDDRAVSQCLDKICVTLSPALRDIVSETNHESDNFFAETIFKTFGRLYSGEGSYSAASRGARFYLDSLGVSLRGYLQNDGSGLSRHNYISPKFFCEFLTMMEGQACFPDYLASLPQPGGEGTLSGFLSGKDSVLKNRIHAKSGSMEGVKCYSGYVETEGGGYIKFSIMLNNFSCPVRRIMPLVEGFVERLALQ